MITKSENIVVTSKQKELSNAHELLIVLILTLGLALISQVQVYIYIVPLTLQTSYVALMALIVSKKVSFKYLSLYIILAAMGMPVLTNMQGLNRANIMDFGFVIGFIVLAYLINTMWNKRENKNIFYLVYIIIVSNAILYIIGFSWVLVLGNKMSILTLIPFAIFDVLKMIGVITIYNLITNYRQNKVS